jgi:hypothetical protein
MNQLMLSLEALCVDSFQTAQESPARGTVLGRDSTAPTQPAPSGPSDYGVCTYDASCQGGCSGPRTCTR